MYFLFRDKKYQKTLRPLFCDAGGVPRQRFLWILGSPRKLANMRGRIIRISLLNAGNLFPRTPYS